MKPADENESSDLLEDLETALKETGLSSSAVDDLVKSLKWRRRRRNVRKIVFPLLIGALVLGALYLGIVIGKSRSVSLEGNSASLDEETVEQAVSMDGERVPPDGGTVGVSTPEPDPVSIPRTAEFPRQGAEPMEPEPLSASESEEDTPGIEEAVDPVVVEPADPKDDAAAAPDVAKLSERPGIEAPAPTPFMEEVDLAKVVPYTVQVNGINGFTGLSRLAEKMKSSAVPFSIQQLVNKKKETFLRIWVGQYGSPDKASSAAEWLQKRLGLNVRAVPRTSRVELRPYHGVELDGLSEHTDASRQHERLAGAGYSTTLQTIIGEGGALSFRVWVGHFRNRGKAEAFVDRLYRNEGMRGHVVERTSVVNASSRYTCGIMREKDLQGLLELAARLEASGRQAHVQEVMLASGEPRYGIWLGDYGARPEAEKVSRMLEKESAEVFQVWEWR